jgi:uncharacterized membrane protein
MVNGRNMRRRVSIKSFQAQKNAQRTTTDRAADFMTSHFGTMSFLICNVVWFAAWIIVNINIIPGLHAFDPFPFGLLTTAVSLEAIFLAIIVLISQNRASKVADIREEVDLQMDVITEQEVTKLMQLTILLLKKEGIDVSNDKELQYMLKTVSVDKLSTSLEREIRE